MITNKSQKIAKKFLCEKCNYKCCKQSDFNKHLLTIKHKMIMNDNKKSQQIATRYSCDCGKIFKFPSGLSRHKKNCCIMKTDNNSIKSNNNSTILNLISQNKELMNLLVVQKEETKELIEQNKEMQKQNKEMQQTIKEIVPRIGNNTTNNNNNNFNLQVFLNEDCKDALNFSDFINKIQVSFEDLEKTKQKLDILMEFPSYL